MKVKQDIIHRYTLDTKTKSIEKEVFIRKGWGRRYYNENTREEITVPYEQIDVDEAFAFKVTSFNVKAYIYQSAENSNLTAVKRIFTTYLDELKDSTKSEIEFIESSLYDAKSRLKFIKAHLSKLDDYQFYDLESHSEKATIFVKAPNGGFVSLETYIDALSDIYGFEYVNLNKTELLEGVELFDAAGHLLSEEKEKE